MNTEGRRIWMLRHEDLWEDKENLRKIMIKEGALHSNLSNWKYVLDCLIQYCKRIKKIANLTQKQPLKPRTKLIMTEENFDELIKLREVKDILIAQKHPISAMDESGYTYYDYAIYKRKEHKRPVVHVIEEINIFFSGGDINYISEGRKMYFGGKFND